MIYARNLKKSYGDATPVLAGVNLSVSQGEVVALEGRSGAGKTTLLNIIGCLDRDYDGEVQVAGRDPKTMSDNEISFFRNKVMGFVFQSFHLLGHMSVEENVMLPAFFSEKGTRSAKDRARELLEQVGLEPPWTRKTSTLSGGQKQRIAIARALFNRPKLLLCDEPTGNLDLRTGEAVLELLVDLCRSNSVTLVVVTHETWVSEKADRRLVLKDGSVLGWEDARS